MLSEREIARSTALLWQAMQASQRASEPASQLGCQSSRQPGSQAAWQPGSEAARA